jgi:hypothetical protein
MLVTPESTGITLPDTTKKRLKSIIIELRRLFEDDLSRQLKRLGLDPAKAEPMPLVRLTYLTGPDAAHSAHLTEGDSST